MNNKQNETKPNTNQPNPNVTASAADSSGLLRVCLNTGNISEDQYALLDNRGYAAFQILLRNCGGPIEGLPGMDMSMFEYEGGDMIVIRKDNMPIAIGGLVYDASCSSKMWEDLHKIKCLTLSGGPCPPTRTPWLAIAHLHSFGKLDLMEMILVVLFESCWAMARLRQISESKGGSL